MNIIETKLCDIHNITMDEALEQIKEMSYSKSFDIVVTPNIDHMARLCTECKDGDFNKIYSNASLCLCDSKILEKLIRLKGKNVKEVIPGSTLTLNLFEKIITPEDKVLIIGGRTSVITKLRQQYQSYDLMHHNPAMGFIHNEDEIDKIVNIVKNHSFNYIFLALGSPQQEILANILKEKTNSDGVTLCIGASILFIVGEEKRAPLWIQKLHSEWLYRMLQDPRRLFKRYFKNFTMLPKVYNKL